MRALPARSGRSAVVALALVLAACGEDAPRGAPTMSTASGPASGFETKTRFATFGAGCFWCVEAVFKELEGVTSVTSGFSGGHVESPTYKQVCTGTTGHAEVAHIEYDPAGIGYADLLEVFWATHDPTTRNRQGADVGSWYRSVVFFHDAEQKRLAETYKQRLDESGAYPAPIVTEIVPFERFHPAEGYHQDFFERNPEQAYCRATIPPKLDKLRKVFADKLKR